MTAVYCMRLNKIITEAIQIVSTRSDGLMLVNVNGELREYKVGAYRHEYLRKLMRRNPKDALRQIEMEDPNPRVL